MKNIIKNTLVGIGLFVAAILAFHGLVVVSCLNESPGAQVVVGGNSVRCPR